MYRLVEKFSHSKWGENYEDINEDACFDSFYYAVVADGATCEREIYINGQKPGKIASSLVLSYFSQLKENLSFEEVLENLELILSKMVWWK